MPLLTDPTAIRAILETDRAWSTYALGDLDPAQLPFCEWLAPADSSPALLLLYRRFGTPVLFTLGEPASVRALFAEVAHEPRFYLSIRPEILPLVKERYAVHDEVPMQRMVLSADHVAAPDPAAARITREDLPALKALYADGEAAGEAPDFFHAEMVERGVFFGIREGGSLVAVAGTHLVSLAEGVAAVGNVYTRRDRRGRGLAVRVTGAVTAELCRMNLPTIALNVAQRNTPAVRAYERVGFAPHCPFYEGVAVRAGLDMPGES